MLVCNYIPIIRVFHTFSYDSTCVVDFVRLNALTKLKRVGRENMLEWRKNGWGGGIR